MRPEFTRKPEFMRLAAQQKRKSPPLILELLILMLLMVITSVLKVTIGLLPELAWLLSGDRMSAISALLQNGSLEDAVFGLMEMIPAWLYAMLGCLSVVGGIVAIFYCRVIEKRKLATMGLCRGRVLQHLLLGLVLGLGLLGATVGLGVAFHGIRIDRVLLSESQLPLLGLFLLSCVMQGFANTLLLHGYFGVSLNKRFRLSVCIAMPALAYALLFGDVAVPSFVSVLNLFLVALFAGMLMLKTGDVWSLFGVYSFWTLLQSGLLLRTEADDPFPAFFSGEVVGHNELLTGGVGGLGASLCATLVLLAGVGVLVYLLRRQPDDTVPEQPAEP